MDNIMKLLEDKIHVWIDSARYVKAKPGVYVLYNRKEEPIYIGESDNLQKQFSTYLDTNFEDNECKQKTQSYQRKFTESQKEEKEYLLKKFKEDFGTYPKCNSELN
jgi:excinuclease UvrABC nuclease subunit